MNHQVEDDVDIEAALWKRTEAVDFDETRITEHRTRGIDRWIEAFRVADGQNRSRARGGFDHRVRFGETARHRFLDEDGQTRREKWRRDVAMTLGWNRNRHRVDAPEHVAEIESRLRPAGARDLVRARSIRIDDGNEVDAGERRQNAGVMAAEMADADHCNAQLHERNHEDTNTRRRARWFSSRLRVFVAKDGGIIRAARIDRRYRCQRHRRLS